MTANEVGTRPLRIGLVGTGIGQDHADGIALIPELAELTAVCSLELDAARKIATKCGGYATTNFNKLLDDPSIDIIDLCTPPDLHLPMAKAAAQAGKHVLVEKPIALTLEEADEIIAAARIAGVSLMVDQSQRFGAHHMKAKALIDEDVIGTPYMIVATVHVHGHIEGYRRFLTHAGGGTLIDSGVHRFDLLRWLMGDVTSIYGQTGRFLQKQMEGEDCAVVSLRFRSGAIGSFSCSWSAKSPQPEEGLQIFGPRGSILTEDHTQTLKLFTENPEKGLEKNRAFLFKENSAAGIYRAIKSFVLSIQRGEQPPVSGEEGRAALALVLASYQSAKTGQAVYLSA
ncbi:MAG: Gfo/Idh/MocA family oxidoreductase [Anaerolineales bacterium]